MNKLWFAFGLLIAVLSCLYFVKDDIDSLIGKAQQPKVDYQAYQNENILPEK